MEKFHQVVQSHRQLRPIAPASSGTSSGLEEALREAAINPMAPVEPQLNWTLPQGVSCGLAAAHFRCLARGGAQRGRAAQSEPDHRNALRQWLKGFRRKTGLRVAAAAAVQPGGKILITRLAVMILITKGQGSSMKTGIALRSCKPWFRSFSLIALCWNFQSN